MEVKQINQLMLAMGRYGVKRLNIKREGFEIEMEREDKALVKSFEPLGDLLDENPMRGDFERHRSASVVAVENPRAEATKQETDKDESSLFITSPMVGTFYLSPTPNDPSFVKIGDRVEKNTIVCIVEAMKVMNEVKAGVEGTVAEVLFESGHPVEFGSRLLRLV